ncbi:MAG: hypothetical protein ACK4PR_07355, partial [Gammaproteobacteria bacterium]
MVLTLFATNAAARNETSNNTYSSNEHEKQRDSLKKLRSAFVKFAKVQAYSKYNALFPERNMSLPTELKLSETELQTTLTNFLNDYSIVDSNSYTHLCQAIREFEFLGLTLMTQKYNEKKIIEYRIKKNKYIKKK